MLDNLTQKQKNILIIFSIILLIGILYYIYNKNESHENIDLDEEILVSTKETNKETEEQIVVVHIAGCVKTPGIVKLVEGSRIEDAIEAAGGLTEDADISNINLAYILDDGTKIVIPDVWSKDEDSIENSSEFKGNNNLEIKVNINKAGIKELSELPGIGSNLASKIIDYREKNGKFKNIEDIKSVNGIGENKYEDIKNLIII